MHEARPSRTAHELLDSPRVLDDHIARRKSVESISRAFRAFMAVRSRYVEDELTTAIHRGAQ
jgi:hypothetical protein